MAPGTSGDGADHAAERVAVLTVNYGSHHLLERNLAPLTQAMPSLTAVVCDNYTSEAERLQLRMLADRYGWLVVESDTNDGFGAGTNRAAEVALAHGATHLLLLNPDARIDEAGVAVLAAVVSANPAAIAAPALFDVAGTRKAPARHLRTADGIMTEPQLAGDLQPRLGRLPWLSAACLMVGATMWRRIGGMAEEYFLYWEDVEFSYRAWQHGARLTIAEGATCVHDQGGTQRADRGDGRPDPKTPTFFYYSARNRLLFATRNLSPELRAAWRRSSPGAAWFLIKRARGRRAALLHSRDAVWASARGIRDGSRA